MTVAERGASGGGANRWALEAISTGTTFKQSCQLGQSSIADIDDWVDVWHASPVLSCSLAQFLGFSDAEYSRWMENASALYDILKS